MFWGGIISAYWQKFSTCVCCVLVFALLAALGNNNEEYQTEKIERHLQKRFGDRYRSLLCVVHATKLPAAQVTHLMNVQYLRTRIACICTRQGMSQISNSANPAERKMPLHWGWMNWFEIFTMLHGSCEDVPPPTSAIWRRTLHPRTEAPSANSHGWLIGSNNSITINWIIELPAP